MTLASEDNLTVLISITSIFARFSLILANSFCFWYIMESRARFFAQAPVFQANYFRLNEIKVFDILALNC